MGVDMLAQPWAAAPDGTRHLVWCNPPFDLLGPVVRKILDERVDAILVAPQWPRPWQALLRRLPVAHTVDLPRHPGLFLPGQHVAEAKRRAVAGQPHYQVTVNYVLWPQASQRRVFGRGLKAREGRPQPV